MFFLIGSSVSRVEHSVFDLGVRDGSPRLVSLSSAFLPPPPPPKKKLSSANVMVGGETDNMCQGISRF